MRIPIRFNVSPVIRKATELGGTSFAPTGTKLESIIHKINISPSVFTFSEPSPALRNWGENFFRKDFYQVKNLSKEKSAQGLEVEVQLGSDVMRGQFIKERTDLYHQYRERVSKAGIIDEPTRNILNEWEEAIGKSGIFQNRNHLTDKQFAHEVGKAKRRLETGNMNPHPIPEVNQAAQLHYEKVSKPLLDEQIRLGMITKEQAKDPEFVISHLSQIYDIHKIQQNPVEFRDLVTEVFRREAESILPTLRKYKLENKTYQELKKLKKKFLITGHMPEKQLRDAMKKIQEQGFAIEQLQEEANKHMRNIVSKPYGMTSLPMNISSKGRYMKSRKLIIPKDMLDSFERYLINDIDEITTAYLKNTLPRMLYRKKFGQSFTKDLNDVYNDYQKLIESPDITPKERANLQRKQRIAMKNMRLSMNRLLGQDQLPADPYSVLNRFGQVLLKLNNITKLGKVVMASLADFPRQIMTYGMPRVANTMASLLSDIDFSKMAIRDIQRTVGIYESLLQTRFIEMSEIQQGLHGKTTFERLIDAAFQQFGKISGMNLWNQSQKIYAALNSAGMILDAGKALSKGQNVADSDLIHISRMGFDKDDLIEIWNNFKESQGQERHGLYAARADTWENQELANKFLVAIKQDTEVVIANKGVGNLPAAATHPAGKILFQFQTFNFVVTQSALLSGLQKKDISTISGIMLSIFMGSMIYIGYERMAGREPDMSPESLIVNGVDRSGILGWLMNFNSLVERATHDKIGINPIMGTSDRRAHQPRDIFSLLGPSTGTMADIFRTTGALSETLPWAEGNVTPGDIHAMRKLIPYQNLLYLSWLVDRLEKGFVESMGLEENR